MALTIKYRTVGHWRENSYCISYRNEAFLVDPGDEYEALCTDFSDSLPFVKAIINTHGHFDHIGAVHAFQQNFGFPFYLHSNDKRIVHHANLYRKIAGDDTITKTPVIDFLLDEQDSFTLSGKTIRIHNTPGHTAGSVCFEIDNNLISGDLFFADAIGRTDLPGGNREQINASIESVLNRFEGYQIYPGHGSPFLLDRQTIENLRRKLQ